MAEIHGPMRRKEREITDRAEIEEILHNGKILHLALCLENRPFLVPVFLHSMARHSIFIPRRVAPR